MNPPNQSGNARMPALVLSLLIILLIAFFPYIFGGKIFLPADMVDTMVAPFNAEHTPPHAQNHYPYDGLAQTYPYKTETKEALEHGRLSYWNPHILGGYPEYAETMANNYDPFNIFLIWCSPLEVIHIETFCELFIAGLGMLLLLRYFRISPLVNLLFASAYMLNSLFMTSAMHRWIIASFCWVPFVILMIIRYFSEHKKVHLLYGGLFLALSFLGGNFQTSFFALFVTMIVILFYPSSTDKKSIVTRMSILFFIGITGFTLSAFMWLPTLELFIHTIFDGGHLYSTTVHGGYTLLGRFLSIPLLSTYFLPGIAGNPQSFSLKNVIGIDIVNFNGAISFLPALFGFWGCFAFWKRTKTLRPFILIATLGLALPIMTPLYEIFYFRIFIIVSFSLCVVGAVAFQSFIDSETIRKAFSSVLKWTTFLFAFLSLGLALVCTYISLNRASLFSKFVDFVSARITESGFGTGNDSWMLGRVEKTLAYYSFYSPSLWIPIIVSLIIIIAIRYFQRSKLQRNTFLLIVLCATILQLIIFVRTWLPSLDAKQFPIYPRNPIMTFLQNDSSGSRFQAWRNFSRDPYMMPLNSSNVYRTNDLQGFETMTPRTLHVLYKDTYHPDSLNLQFLGLANVKYIVVGKRTVIPPNLKKVFAADSLTIYENLLAKPRGYFVYGEKILASDSAVAKELLFSDFDPEIALFTKETAPPDPGFTSKGENSVHIDKSENEEIDITARTNSKGIFILTDTYYPGWKCSVNGKEQPIYRVNYCMRAILLGPGTSQINFTFEPVIFTVGAGISGIALLLFIGSMILLKKRKRPYASEK